MDRQAGTLIVLAGLIIAGVGLLAMFGLLSWFGRLPGDIRYESGGTRIYFPITTMILVSIALSVAVAIFRRLQ